MPPRPKGPRPGLGTIAAAVTGATRGGTRVTGLSIPMVVMDPRHNFRRGASVYAGLIDKLDMSFRSFKQPLSESLNMVIIPSIKKNFDAQGRPPWKKLRKTTIRSRLMLGFPRGPILQRTHRLKRVATRKNIWTIEPMFSQYNGADLLRLRTEFFDQLVPYGKFMQLGASIPEVKSFSSLHGRIGRTGIAFSPRFADQFVDRTTDSDGRFTETRRNVLYPGSEHGKIPARPYIQLTLDEEAEIYNIFIDFMVGKVNKHWGSGSVGL